MTQNKNQHYVPKFYFKQFSKNNQTICAFNIPKELYIEQATIGGQCSKGYFYSKNIEIEKIFSWLEGLAREKHKKLIENKSLDCLSKEEIQHLKSHILFQHGRTKIAYDRENEMANNFFDTLKPQMYTQLFGEGKAISWESVKNTKIVLNSSYSLLTSMMSGILLYDLQVALLENTSKTDFIFSDNPVVLFNSYFNDIHPYGTTGIAATGLQIFYPIDSRTMIFLFDPNFYKLKNEKIDISKQKDVQRLNGLQILTCDKNVYFEDDSMKDKVIERYKQIKSKIPKTKTEYEVVKIEKTPDGTRELYRTSNPKIKYNLEKLSFLKHKNNNTPYGLRDPLLVDLHKKVVEAVDEGKIKSMDDLSQFIDDLFKKENYH